MKDFILKIARRAVENYVKTGQKLAVPKEYPEEMQEKRGVFVTIYKKGMLRGCIGIPFPEKPLIEGLIEASVEVCNDPRFPPLSENELKDIKIEVSILSDPKLIKTEPKNYKKFIEIGKDGLILRRGMREALFLPKVPIEQGWKLEEYLENLCLKAGLTADSWLDPDSKLYKFEAGVFSEGI